MPRVNVEAMAWLAEVATGNRSPRAAWTWDLPEGATLRDLLQALHEREPELGRLVWNQAGGYVEDHATVLVNERVYEAAGGLDRPLADGDRVVLLPSFAGGSPR